MNMAPAHECGRGLNRVFGKFDVEYIRGKRFDAADYCRRRCIGLNNNCDAAIILQSDFRLEFFPTFRRGRAAHE